MVCRALPRVSSTYLAQPDVWLLVCALIGQHARHIFVNANDDTGNVGIQLHQIMQLILATERLNT